jgi:hypothetical protein
VVSGVLLAGMVAAAWYAVVGLPKAARVPLHAGTPEWSIWLPKAAGLAVWLGGGALAFATLAALTLSGAAANWASSLRVTLTPAVLLVVLAAEVAAINSARQAAAEPAEPGENQ